MVIDLSKTKLKRQSKKLFRSRFGVVKSVFFSIIIETDNGKENVGTISFWYYPDGSKEVGSFVIIPKYRRMGIGTYVLKTFAKGYYIGAANKRATSLYKRLGKREEDFTPEEKDALIRNFSSFGYFKIGD